LESQCAREYRQLRTVFEQHTRLGRNLIKASFFSQETIADYQQLASKTVTYRWIAA